MLSFQLQQKAEKLSNIFKEDSELFTVLRHIDSFTSEANKFISKIVKSGYNPEGNKDAINNLCNSFINIRNVAGQISQRKFYSSVDKIQDELKLIMEEDQDKNNFIKEMYNHIESFAVEFEKATAPPYPIESAISLSIRANRLVYLIKGLQSSLLFFSKNIGTYIEDADMSVTNISLLLSSKMTARQFAQKILIIEKIYIELCSLINISSSEYPLLINKIESGSMWLKLFGNNKVIGMMVEFIKSSASYMYRNYTKEGKLSALPRKIESIEAILGLSKRLESEGIKTDEIKDHIAKSAVSLAKEISILMEGQAEVTVNNQHYSIGEELQKKLIEDNSSLLLQYDSEHGPENGDQKKDNS